uniref:Secreted protein n=1 Tax=Plectus sambesii TaxID=2011161 RepID=A0A914WF35_9BILA
MLRLQALIVLVAFSVTVAKSSAQEHEYRGKLEKPRQPLLDADSPHRNESAEVDDLSEESSGQFPIVVDDDDAAEASTLPPSTTSMPTESIPLSAKASVGGGDVRPSVCLRAVERAKGFRRDATAPLHHTPPANVCVVNRRQWPLVTDTARLRSCQRQLRKQTSFRTGTAHSGCGDQRSPSSTDHRREQIVVPPATDVKETKAFGVLRRRRRLSVLTGSARNSLIG